MPPLRCRRELLLLLSSGSLLTRPASQNGAAFEWYASPAEQSTAEAEVETPLQRALRLALASRRAAAVLDLGCGTSRLAAALARGGHAVVAVDISAAAVAAAALLCGRDAAAAAAPAFVVADACALPLPSAALDVVVDKGTLDSLDCVGGRAAQRAAAEAFRVLRPGGSLVCASCRDAPGRMAMLLEAGFAVADGPVDVWAEPAAPCPTYFVAVLSRPDVSA